MNSLLPYFYLILALFLSTFGISSWNSKVHPLLEQMFRNLTLSKLLQLVYPPHDILLYTGCYIVGEIWTKVQFREATVVCFPRWLKSMFFEKFWMVPMEDRLWSEEKLSKTLILAFWGKGINENPNFFIPSNHATTCTHRCYCTIFLFLAYYVLENYSEIIMMVYFIIIYYYFIKTDL